MMEKRTREKIINEGGSTSNDPRVDTPEIKVIYPPEEETVSPESSRVAEPTKEETTDEPITEEQQEVKDDHVCKVSVQQAIEQNWIYFTLIAVALFGLGYALGKSKAK